MISKISELPDRFKESVSFARVKALYNTYNKNIGIDMFVQTVDEQVTAFFGGVENSFSLVTCDSTDFLELDTVFKFLGATVFCDGDVADKLLPNKKTKSGLFEYMGDFNSESTCFDSKISDVYEALKMGEDGDIDLPPFEYWYTDFCARYNKKSAEYVMNDCAVAVCGFMTQEISLITGVSVPKENRKKGDGKKVLCQLLTKIHNTYKYSRVMVVARDTVSGFYLKSGFEKIGQVAVLEY